MTVLDKEIVIEVLKEQKNPFFNHSELTKLPAE
jgi:hypothetical protein